MRCPLLLVPVLIACGSGGAPRAPRTPAPSPASGAAAAPASMVGTYRERHPVQVVCDSEEGWCEQSREDVLEVRAAADGALAITVELVQDNDHTCSFEGTLAPAPSDGPDLHAWRFQRGAPAGQPAEDDEEACTLDLTASAVGITLSSEGCREYCGARARLEASFQRARTR